MVSRGLELSSNEEVVGQSHLSGSGGMAASSSSRRSCFSILKAQVSRQMRGILLIIVITIVIWNILLAPRQESADTDELGAQLIESTTDKKLQYVDIRDYIPPTQRHHSNKGSSQESSNSEEETFNEDTTTTTTTITTTTTTVDTNTLTKTMMNSDATKEEDEKGKENVEKEAYSVPKQDQLNEEVLESVAEPITQQSSCSPRHHIMFLKTHKCASSTVQNILLRYGYQHNLTFALGHGHYLGYSPTFKYHMLNRALLTSSGRADIFTLHSRLNIPEHQKAMYPDAKWITIVRDPVEQFSSVFAYYQLNKFYKKDLETFLKQPIEVLRSPTLPRYEGKQGRNTVLFDMGYPDVMPSEKMREVMEIMDNLFHYVMISERMDESLILLKHELCWTNDDIMGFTKNARVDGKEKLPQALADKITQMNAEDTVIYKHFLDKHIKAVEMFGIDKMAKEVSELEELRKQYFDTCVAEEVLGHDKRLSHKEWKGNVNAYLPNDTNDETCKLILMGEVEFVQLVMNKQKDLIKRIKDNT